MMELKSIGNQGVRELNYRTENADAVPAETRAGPTGPQFTIRSIMIITIIMAIGSAGIGQLWRAANGHLEDIGLFVIVTSMAPLGLMIAINWFLRLFRMH